ncbi:WD40/YVTN/BNR-like repeat-containing protein [Aquiflexum sp.]|uniref:WD40/YVTN/BNR-like repeat-containing protein n=1 Tax=Aquiflexum sp. TaxID=1872584 RepID=UPI0035947893
MAKYLFSLFLIFGLLSCSEEKKAKIPEVPSGWQKMDTRTEASLRGLSPLTDQIVWASGSDGTWLRTLNGGETWESGVIAGMDTVDFRDIEAIDANTAIVLSAGQPAVIYKTMDGGNTWEKKFQGTDEDFFDGMAFIHTKGYVVGDVVDGKWALIETKNEGDTWKILELSPDGPKGGGSFAASGSGILVDYDNIWFASAGNASKIYHSSDNGYHWNTFDTPIIQEKDSQGIFSLAKIGGGVMVGVGGDFLKIDGVGKNFVISVDNGKTWRLGEGQAPSGFRSGVQYFQRFHWLICVGPNGSDFSKDGGENWVRFSDEGFHAVKMDKTSTSIWASGSDGVVAKLVY